MAKSNPAEAIRAANARIVTLEATVKRITIERNVAQGEVESLTAAYRRFGQQQSLKDASRIERIAQLKEARAKAQCWAVALSGMLLVSIVGYIL